MKNYFAFIQRFFGGSLSFFVLSERKIQMHYDCQMTNKNFISRPIISWKPYLFGQVTYSFDTSALSP